jgi:hypothetical protein
MRQMPFGWAGIGHRLDLLVFRRQRCRQLEARLANLIEQCPQPFASLHR